jgi:diacylglycerol kinase (ATP)
MARAFVIFNPAARGEKSWRVQRFLQAKAAANHGVVLAPTAAPGDATRLAAQAVADDCKLIVAAGGDGTINEVINGIGTSGVTLAILPFGTVNVFARELAVPRRLDAAWALIERAEARMIDLACAEANGARRYFAQLAGVGFDAAAVRCANWELKKRVGPLSYVWAGMQTLSRPTVTVEVSVNGTGARGRGPAVLIGNGRFYGGSFRMFPQARLDDGLLDVCVFENIGYFNALRYGQRVLRGAHTRNPGVCYFQAKAFSCSASAPVPFELDGEDAGDAPVRFSVVPRALRVIAPCVEGGNGHA